MFLPTAMEVFVTFPWISSESHKTDCTANEQGLSLYVLKFPVQVAVVFLVILGHWPQFEDVMR